MMLVGSFYERMRQTSDARANHKERETNTTTAKGLLHTSIAAKMLFDEMSCRRDARCDLLFIPTLIEEQYKQQSGIDSYQPRKG